MVSLLINNVKPVNQSIQNPIVIKKDEEPQNSSKISDIKKYALPISLLAGGGILLYLGVKQPTNNTIFKELIKSKLSKIEEKTAQAKAEILNISEDVCLNLISNLNKFHLPIDLLLKPNSKQKNIVGYVEERFNTLNKKYTTNRTKSLIDELNDYFYQFTREYYNKTNDIKTATNLDVYDITHLPELKDKVSPNLLQKGVNELTNSKNSSQTQLNKHEQQQFEKIKKTCFEKAKEVVLNLYTDITKLKDDIIKMAYSKLNINHVPYSQQLELTQYKIEQPLSQSDRNLLNLLSKKMFSSHLHFLSQYDLTKINEETFRKIFFSMPKSDNLKELLYTADRLNIRQHSINSNKYDNIINQLLELHTKLKAYGEKELLKLMEFDFSNLSTNQLKAQTIRLDNITKRLGYRSAKELEEKFLITIPKYKESQFSNFIKTITNDSEYFI